MQVHPSLALLSDSFTREDLFLVVYCLVDDWTKVRYGSANAPRKRRGPRSDEFSDAEALTVLLVRHGEFQHQGMGHSCSSLPDAERADGKTAAEQDEGECAHGVVPYVLAPLPLAPLPEGRALRPCADAVAAEGTERRECYFLSDSQTRLPSTIS